MDEKLTLNDGTELQGYALDNGSGRLFIYLDEIDMDAAFALFYDPEKTASIRGDRYGETRTYEGYTCMQSISRGIGRQINISMTEGSLWH